MKTKYRHMIFNNLFISDFTSLAIRRVLELEIQIDNIIIHIFE